MGISLAVPRFTEMGVGDLGLSTEGALEKVARSFTSK